MFILLRELLYIQFVFNSEFIKKINIIYFNNKIILNIMFNDNSVIS